MDKIVQEERKDQPDRSEIVPKPRKRVQYITLRNYSFEEKGDNVK